MKERRKLQHNIENVKRKEFHKKYLSSILSKRSLGFLKKSSLDQLEDHGYLRKDLLNDIQRSFIPWLSSQIYDDLQLEANEEHNTTNYLKNVQNQIVEFHSGFVKKEKDRRRKNQENRLKIQQELEEAKRKRKERRIAKRKMREKTEMFENLKKFIISYPLQNNEIFDAEITDITGDKKKKPIGNILCH